MNKFTTQRVRESNDRMFGGAVCRLQRYAPNSKRRTNLDDPPAIPRKHPPESSEGAVDLAQIIYLCDAPKLRSFHLLDW